MCPQLLAFLLMGAGVQALRPSGTFQSADAANSCSDPEHAVIGSALLQGTNPDGSPRFMFAAGANPGESESTTLSEGCEAEELNFLSLACPMIRPLIFGQ